jgi:hypothetical protein
MRAFIATVTFVFEDAPFCLLPAAVPSFHLVPSGVVYAGIGIEPAAPKST